MDLLVTSSVRLARGVGADEERAQAAQLVTKLETDAAATQGVHDNPGFWKKLGGGLASFTEEGRQATLDEEGNHQQAMSGRTKTLRALEQAIQRTPSVVNQRRRSTGYDARR